ncbi:uncharacterized protein CCOS01_03642 [Colletotrichum costaricense]|uniref:Uncharacterized protein n=1 Tax=Colletotrichum costaricense TaxID=1209916 RepID=A0AAJ0E4A8_9PEZI|nr:uncharacterized protein CCOS01_03642 [Colletotrichum costaricense]KAK1534890.1 hypothetical protein CCOS01_03642 [Colletotrichum costaricense]
MHLVDDVAVPRRQGPNNPICWARHLADLSTVPRTLGAVCGGAIVDKTALLLLMMMIPTYDLGNLAEKVGDDVSYQHTFDTLSMDNRLHKFLFGPRARLRGRRRQRAC